MTAPWLTLPLPSMSYKACKMLDVCQQEFRRPFAMPSTAPIELGGACGWIFPLSHTVVSLIRPSLNGPHTRPLNFGR
ncbi:hypothetical protein BKA70DRAFT_1438012 [Coprinopsis sp. MPI-PUGE-AT-0042]|nr:hypothetical protein BKA70DRAFT_1438012 [Coprinopsis sp. MPI-PUGE-AT-0042]